MESKLNQDIINRIIELTKKELKEHNIINEIIRDDVFSILDSHCIILYFPLENENINGYHISKRIKDELKDFVFINTANTTEKQVFAAAHELGHILNIDTTIINEFNLEESKELSELIINRFAAELLMPQDIFNNKVNIAMKELKVENNKITVVNMITIIICFMNEFLVEFEAIVRRFNELGKIADSAMFLLLELKNDPAFQDEIIAIAKAANFTRLFIINNNKSISDLKEYADKATESQTLTEEKITKILNTFGIKSILPKDCCNADDSDDSIDLL